MVNIETIYDCSHMDQEMECRTEYKWRLQPRSPLFKKNYFTERLESQKVLPIVQTGQSGSTAQHCTFATVTISFIINISVAKETCTIREQKALQVFMTGNQLTRRHRSLYNVSLGSPAHSKNKSTESVHHLITATCSTYCAKQYIA